MFLTTSMNRSLTIARKIEIAIWKMASTRNALIELLLLTNELDLNKLNLSFEREFGRVYRIAVFSL